MAVGPDSQELPDCAAQFCHLCLCVLTFPSVGGLQEELPVPFSTTWVQLWFSYSGSPCHLIHVDLMRVRKAGPLGVLHDMGDVPASPN